VAPDEPQHPPVNLRSSGRESTDSNSGSRDAPPGAVARSPRRPRFDTLAVHGAYGMAEALAWGGSIIEPLILSSAQHFPDSDTMEEALAYRAPAWAYTRIANPTVGYLESTLSLLEGYGYSGGVSACATASGMAAVFMATNPFLEQAAASSGRHRPNIVATAKCYGGTFMLFHARYGLERGIDVRWVREPADTEEWARAIDEDTRVVYGEMPSNPSLAVFDVAAVADLAHAAGVPLIVDSTVATPALLRPLCHGADIVVHSISKSLAASGLVIAGAVVARHDITSRVGSDELRADFARYVKLFPGRDHGPALSPFSALLALSDMRTIRPRMDRLSRSTQRVAEHLATHPGVEDVWYPGLSSCASHDLASRYMTLVDGDDEGHEAKRFGHLLAFTVAGGEAAARRAFDALSMIWRATDLGRVKSVATIPAISTHQQQGAEGRAVADVPAHLVRLSVGSEHPDDIIEDLDTALAAAR
jgi:O-acetylhomoserine/O-acetylserine sulfhydrylase-like pyridoxal-dependent enzyme